MNNNNKEEMLKALAAKDVKRINELIELANSRWEYVCVSMDSLDLMTSLNAKVSTIKKLAIESDKGMLKPSASLYKATGTIMLDLSNSFFHELSSEIRNLGHITLIQFPNSLIKIPRELNELKKLNGIMSSTNILAELATVGLKQNLTLVLKTCDTKTLPKEIGDLKSIVKITANGIGLSAIPKELCDLPILEILELEDNDLNILPIELLKMQTLKSLKIEGNKKLILPKDFLQMKVSGENLREIKKCVNRGSVDPTLSKMFVGQKWCVTGTFKNYKPREEALELIELMGGDVGKSVDQSTTHLLAGDKAGDKTEKAKKLNVRIVSEVEFMELINPKNASGNVTQNKKAETWNEDGASFLKELGTGMKSYAESRDAKLNLNKIPQRYKDFLETGEYLKYENMYREFYEELHQFKFADYDLIELGISDEFYDTFLAFAEEKYDKEEKAYMIWPFSELFGPHQSSSICLFIDLLKPKCPIYIFDETDIREVEPSLDKFLASLKEKKG